jgi:putative transposase
MIMGFIDAMRAQGHAVESICRVLREQDCQIAARTYRSWKQTGRDSSRIAVRTITDAHVVEAVRTTAWSTNQHGVRKLAPEGLYGRRKMTAVLRRTTAPAASAGSVDRAMRALGLVGVRRDRHVRTTVPAKDGVRAGDLLDRDFTAPAPNIVWVTDFTYVRTWSPAWVYVAFIVDVFSQRIVAWHASTSKATDLVMIPLRMALWERNREGNPTVPGELIHHSDAGSQYTSLRLTEHLALEEIRPSIGSVGDAYDNALMESINGLYKAECIRTTVFHDGPYKTIADVEYATAGWVDWYNNRRLHSTLGYVSPVEYEQAHYAALNRELHPV